MRLARALRLAMALGGVVALSTVVPGCGGSPTSPSGTAPFSQTDLRLGTGAEAVNGSVVSVNYTAWFFDASKLEQKGLEFDSSVGLTTPFSFTLGAGSVIAGWERGVVGMKVGGIRRLVIPPSLAYGPNRYDRIPPNATLVFEVELVGVQ